MMHRRCRLAEGRRLRRACNIGLSARFASALASDPAELGSEVQLVCKYRAPLIVRWAAQSIGHPPADPARGWLIERRRPTISHKPLYPRQTPSFSWSNKLINAFKLLFLQRQFLSPAIATQFTQSTAGQLRCFGVALLFIYSTRHLTCDVITRDAFKKWHF